MDGLNNAVYNVVEFILGVLPDSPFQFLQELSNSPVAQWLRWLNWFIPINLFIGIFQAWLSAIAIYYVYQMVLRWAKAIE